MATGGVDPQALNGLGGRTGARDESGAGVGFNASVNGLRGLCVAAVFVFHVAGSGLPPLPSAASGWQLAAAYGVGSLAHGVEVFFMISGYVIVLSLRRHASVGGFLADRCLRIFPLWMPMALLIGITGPWLGLRVLHDLDALAWLRIMGANLLLLPPLLPLPMLHPASWSLTVEWLFYGVAAGLMALWRLPWVPSGAFAGGTAVALLVAFWLWPVALCFAIGVGVALWPRWTARALRWQGLAAPSLLLFLLLWRSVDAAGLDTGARLPELLMKGQGPALLAALLAGTFGLACLCAPGSTAMPLLRTRWLQRLGTISYSFYLWHLLVMFAVKRGVLRVWPDGQGAWTATLVFAALSLAVSWGLSELSWRWVERAFGRWLRRRLVALKPMRPVVTA